MSGSPLPPVEVIPPYSPAVVFRVLGVGVGLSGLAAVVGLAGGNEPSPLSTVRLVLTATGVLAAACGLVMRPGDWRAWVAAGAAAWLAVAGLPPHWDSGRLVAGVLGSLAIAGALLTALPGWRFAALSVFVLFHFGAFLTSTTSPETAGFGAPWVTQQASERVYKPYWKFLYLGNAYHFYSPDPGPASHLFFLVQYETDEDEVDEKTGQAKLGADGKPMKKRTAEWVDMPRRRTQYRDPLGMTYYRRLSLTELVSYSMPGQATLPSREKALAVQRRRDNFLGLVKESPPVPGAVVNNEIDLSQYRVPHSHLRRFMLPSYARHIAAEYTGPRTGKDGRPVQYTVTRVKMFRVEHRVITPDQFLEYQNSAVEATRRGDRNPNLNVAARTEGGNSPFHPSLYFPYYLGEFDRAGELTNPQDPLLYWLLPIQYLPNRPADAPTDFKDYMSEYVGYTFDWRGKE